MSKPEEITSHRRPQPYIQRYPDQELADCIELDCMEYGFLQRLRDFSMRRGGIPDSEETILRLAKSFHLSKYKLQKIWPTIENFLTLRDGHWYYMPDEDKRLQELSSSDKRRVAGTLGARVRWSGKVAQMPNPGEPGDGSAISAESASPSQTDGKLELDSRSQIQSKGAAAAQDIGTTEAAGAAPPLIAQGFIEALAIRCAELELQVPDKKLCIRLLQRFPTLPPGEYPKFHEQRSPGLWLEKSIDDMVLESRRQAFTPKKPTRAEAQEEKDQIARAAINSRMTD